MVVVDDPAAAAQSVAAGDDVVLVVATALAPGWKWPTGPGRLALFAGDPTDPAVLDAAAAMGAELWPSGPARARRQNSTSTR